MVESCRLVRHPWYGLLGLVAILGVGTAGAFVLVAGPPPSWTRGSAMSDATARYFSTDYFTARSRFRERVRAARGRLEQLAIDARGPGGEALTIDIGWFGVKRPRRLLLHSSGIHGVEGFAGSAIQLQFLDSLPRLEGDRAIVLVHFLNPYGVAWLRRVNEENVDLNRNFLGPSEAYAGAPAGYGSLDSILNPLGPPAWDFFYARAIWQVARHGMTALKQSVATGQYDYPRGLFFGGKRLQQGPERYQAFLRERLWTARRVIAIDVHTGVGEYGEDLLLAEETEYHAARQVFGARGTLADPDRSAAYRVRGGYENMLSRVFPDASVHFVAQEFGTYRPLHVVRALREENRWHHHGEGGIAHPTKRGLRVAFSPDDDAWRRSVLSRGQAVLEEAMEGLRRLDQP
jgi:Protein of unknown function (DUF2817)